MSDAAFDGYHCHGPMEPVRLAEVLADKGVLGGDRVVVYWCTCGVWRHATSPIRDVELRAVVSDRMSLLSPRWHEQVRQTTGGV